MEEYKRRALVLSGGGARGAFQAGAILRLHELGNRYDGYFGVSVGAINAVHMAQFSQGHELLGALELKEKWHRFSNKDIWKHHNAFLKWLIVPWKLSAFDTTPLRSYLRQHLNVQHVIDSGKKLAVGMVDMTTGQYTVYDHAEAGAGADSLLDAVYSSAAYPIMFEMGRVPSPDGHHMSDGGLVHVTPLKSAIKWGADQIDVITLDPPGMSAWQPKNRKWWQPKLQDVAIRTLDIIIQNIIERDLVECQRVNRRVNEGRGDDDHRFITLRIFRPLSPIPIGSLDFDPADMALGSRLGYELIDSLLGTQA